MSIDSEVRLYEPVIHEDERGWFYESYNQEHFDDWVGRVVQFVQDSHSLSAQGVLRGLHYQLPPRDQAKLVRVTRGAIFDVVVDIRKSSSSYGKWRGFELSESRRTQLWIPPGFAHGFLALTDGAEVQYKVTDFFSPTHSRIVRWDDPDLAIDWPPIERKPLLSEKDSAAPALDAAEVFD